MPDLSKKFGRKEWKTCCGKGCKKCEIAQAYIGEHGRKKGLGLLNEDRAAATKGKGLKKGPKAHPGKKLKDGSARDGKKAAKKAKGKKPGKK